MSFEEFGLERKVYTSATDLQEIYTPWSDCVSKYKSDIISRRWKYEYSKIRAVHKLYESIKSRPHAPALEDGPLLKALLTDQSLLFPQTRERGYDTFHSMRASLRAIPRYRAEASRLGRLTYDECLYEFYEIHSRDVPFISAERIKACIECLEAKFSRPWVLKETSEEFEIGYILPKISKCSYERSPEEVEYLMKAWTDHVRLIWGDGENFLDAKAMKGILGLSTVELYEFLAFVLRKLLPQCNRRDEWSAVSYHPVLNNAQLAALSEQIKCFNRETFQCWKRALPVLEDYLHPNLEPFTNLKQAIFEAPDTQSESCGKLAKAFQRYLHYMEPSAKETDLFCKEAAEWFLSFSPNEKSGDKPFLASPHLIFHLFRSPIYRYVVHYEDRNWNLKRVIEDAYMRKPLPITLQSLEADTALFAAIVNICAEECTKVKTVFHKEEWYSLWQCIRQCVQCLRFQSSDLFSLRDSFVHVLYLRDLGTPVLDLWIEQKLTSGAPNYIQIWSVLINRLCNPSKTRSSILMDAVEAFRNNFVDPTVKGACTVHLLGLLSSEIKWAGITLLPSAQELADINSAIKPRARNKEADAIRYGIRTMRRPASDNKEALAAEKEQVRISFKRVWMEWLLLQCVCDQARRELMEAVYLYLSNAKNPPV